MLWLDTRIIMATFLNLISCTSATGLAQKSSPRADSSEFESRSGRDFPGQSRPAPRNRVSFQGIRRSGCDDDHAPPSIAGDDHR